jgi:hypothetical protein
MDPYSFLTLAAALTTLLTAAVDVVGWLRRQQLT